MGSRSGGSSSFAYGAITLCGLPFHAGSARRELCNSLRAPPHSLNGPTTPIRQRRWAITSYRFGLSPFRSPLLRGSRLLSLPPGTEMFHFPGFPRTRLCVQRVVTGHYASRVAPFGDPRIGACLAAPRGLSQPATSFIGSWRQGIHRVPFVPWLFDAHARYGILKLLPGSAFVQTVLLKENRRSEDRRQPPARAVLAAVLPRRS